MSDFRIPVPGAALPAWRRNPAYQAMNLSHETIAALDESEAQEQVMRERLLERTAAHRAQILGANAAQELQHAEQVRQEGLSNEQLRAELTIAIDAHSAAQQQLAAANGALGRAKEGVATAESRLARFAGVDERVAAFNADRFRDGELAAMPCDLIEARRARGDAAQLLEDVQAAYVALAGEAQAARLRVEDRARARDQAAIAIIARHVDGVAGEIEQTVDRLHDLHQRVLSISGLWVPLAVGTGPLPVSDRVRMALRRTEQRPLVSEELKASARSWFLELQSNPAAVLGE